MCFSFFNIVGGNRHLHQSDETCYDNNVHFFNLKCRKWVSESVFSVLSPVSSQSTKPQRGRFSHVALLRDSVLLIFGGYSGAPLGNMYVYKLPEAVAVVNRTGMAAIAGHCSKYLTSGTCVPDPACGWCGSQAKCFVAQNSSNCSSDWQIGSCAGPCGVHSQCTSCLTWGSRHTPKCGWCVQDSRCYPVTSPMNACETPTSSNMNKIKGWWGASGQFLTGSVDQCRSSDYPPGLIAIWHTHPVNSNQPDEVTMVSTSKDTIAYDGILWDKFLRKTLVGFIYPFKYKTSPWPIYFVRAKSSNSFLLTNTLYLSTDASKNKLVRSH